MFTEANDFHPAARVPTPGAADPIETGVTGLRPAVELAVSQVFGVARDDIGMQTRGRAHVALARHVAMYLAHVAYGLSLTDVGRLFARDRTTVAHACALVEDRRDDQPFDRALELLELVVRALASPRPLAC